MFSPNVLYDTVEKRRYNAVLVIHGLSLLNKYTLCLKNLHLCPFYETRFLTMFVDYVLVFLISSPHTLFKERSVLPELLPSGGRDRDHILSLTFVMCFEMSHLLSSSANPRCYYNRFQNCFNQYLHCSGRNIKRIEREADRGGWGERSERKR